MIPHYLNHFDSSNNKGAYFNYLRKYHNQYHFGGEVKRFGVLINFGISSLGR